MVAHARRVGVARHLIVVVVHHGASNPCHPPHSPRDERVEHHDEAERYNKGQDEVDMVEK